MRLQKDVRGERERDIYIYGFIYIYWLETLSCQGTYFRNARLCIILLFAILGAFVRNFGSVFANVFEVLFKRNSRGKSITFWWLGGGFLEGTKIENKHVVNKLAFPSTYTKLHQKLK